MDPASPMIRFAHLTLIGLFLTCGCIRRSGDFYASVSRDLPVPECEAVVAQDGIGLHPKGLVFQQDQLPEEARRLVSALEQELRSRAAVRPSPSSDGVVLTADRAPGPSAKGTWVWPDWHQPSEAFLIEDSESSEFIGPRHLQIRSAGGHFIVDARDPSLRIALPERMGSILVGPTSRYAAIRNGVEIGRLSGGELRPERTLQPAPRQYSGSHGLLFLRERFVVLSGVTTEGEWGAWFFDLTEASPAAHDLGAIEPLHVSWHDSPAFCALRDRRWVRVELHDGGRFTIESIPLAPAGIPLAVSPSGRVLFASRQMDFWSFFNIWSGIPTRSASVAGRPLLVTTGPPAVHDWAGGYWLSWDAPGGPPARSSGTAGTTAPRSPPAPAPPTAPPRPRTSRRSP